MELVANNRYESVYKQDVPVPTEQCQSAQKQQVKKL
jgi:hypothetical protein